MAIIVVIPYKAFNVIDKSRLLISSSNNFVLLNSFRVISV